MLIILTEASIALVGTAGMEKINKRMMQKESRAKFCRAAYTISRRFFTKIPVGYCKHDFDRPSDR